MNKKTLSKELMKIVTEIDLITIKESIRNNLTNLCLLSSENKLCNFRVILMKKQLKIIKVLGRQLNRSYLTKLIHMDEITESDINIAHILNTFFFNRIIKFIIAEYTNHNSISENINDPVLKSIIKYTSHKRMLIIGEVWSRQEESLFLKKRLFKKCKFRFRKRQLKIQIFLPNS